MAKRQSVKYCSVFGCLNSSATHPEMTFFKLPANSERRVEWLRLICRNDLKNKTKFISYRVCEKHFKVENIHESPNRKLLKKNALPLCMLPSVSSAVPARFWKEDKQTQTDLSIGVENCTQTENAANESYAQTSTSLSCNTPRKRKLKAHFDDNDVYTNMRGNRRVVTYAVSNVFPNPLEGPGPSGSSDNQTKDRVSTCKGTKLLPLLKNAEDIIASVYNYLQAEYEQLKSSIGGHCDLSPLANILARTAAATGVSELAVSAILEQRKRSADEEPLDAGTAKRAKLHDYGDGNVSPITDDEESCDAPDKEQDKNKQTQCDSQEPEKFGLETLKVEIKEEEKDKPADPLQLQMSEFEADSAVQHILTNISTTTINTQSLDVVQRPGVVVYPQSDSGVLRVISIEPMTSLATVKTEPDDDPPDSDTPSSDAQFEPPS